MARFNSADPVSQPDRASAMRWLPPAALLAGVMVVLALVLTLPALRGSARAGAAYGARIACTCRYVGGRTLADCASDFEPGMALVSLREDAAARSVTARAALLMPQTATWLPGSGCVLEKWAG